MCILLASFWRTEYMIYQPIDFYLVKSGIHVFNEKNEKIHKVRTQSQVINRTIRSWSPT